MRLNQMSAVAMLLLMIAARGAMAQTPPYGQVIVDGDPTLTTSGVVMRALSARPSVAAQTSTADSGSGFIVFNSANTELLRVRSDGKVGVGTPSPRSILHLVRTATGVGPELILENNAGTVDDAAAITFASNGAARAQIYSGVDASSANGTLAFKTGLTTLSTRMTVSAAGDVAIVGGGLPLKLTSVSGAIMMFKDMQNWFGVPNGIRLEMAGNSDVVVSGMQIGKNAEPVIQSLTAPLYLNRYSQQDVIVPAKFRVEDLTRDSDLIVAAGDNPGDPNQPTMTLMRKDGNDAQVAKYGLRLDAADGNKFKLLYGATADFTSTLLSVDVAGNLAVTGNITGAKVFNAVYQDLAEWVPATLDMAPGTVVILNPDKANEVMPSAREYDASVAGVVSAQPGVLLGAGGTGQEMIATTGRVRVKVDATAAPIRIGDLLVTSNKSGYAMKSIPVELSGIAMHRPGTIVGKALEALEGGEGEILVLLSLQ